ncbi:MAG: protein kinase [Myxococcales bacterium]|nr:protein kinase [Myxococcales bacterium]
MDNATKRISNFHLGRKVYGGKKCDIYEARYAQAGGVVQSAVVKVLKSEFACIGEEVRNFLREIDWARTLCHSIFPRIMEAGEHEGNYFLAMERIDGWTLETFLRDLSLLQVRIPPQVALTLIHQIADGMQSMHEYCEDSTRLGVVHLGLEPSNIMLRRTGVALVVDFGETMAAGVGDVAMLGDSAASYQAPERLRMLPVDCRADIYSLGRILESMSECIPSSEIGTDLRALIARACSVHTEERFSSMREFMTAIEGVASDSKIDFSCHACSLSFSEIFGTSESRTDPRANRPRAAAPPLHMASEGMLTAHGLLPEEEPELETEISPSEVPRFVDRHVAITTIGVEQSMSEPTSSERRTTVVSSAEGEATVCAAERLNLSRPRRERKPWPEELVATKAYNLKPDTDDELAVAIERLRR